MQRTLAAVAAVMLAGCSAGPIPMEAAARYRTPREGAGHIVVTQGPGVLCQSRIYIRGVPVVDIDAGQRADLYVDPGETIIGMNGTHAACRTDSIDELETTVAAGQTKHFKIVGGVGLQASSN